MTIGLYEFLIGSGIVAMVASQVGTMLAVARLSVTVENIKVQLQEHTP